MQLQQAIISRKPYLQSYIQADLDPALRFGQTPQGVTLVQYEKNPGVFTAIASTRDPLREAKRLLPEDHAHWQGTEIIVLLGLANPLLLQEISKFLKESQICLAIDANFGLGTLYMQQPEIIKSYLEKPGCHLFCGDSMRDLMDQYLSEIPSERLSGVRIITHGASRRLAPQFYATIEERLSEILKARMSDLMTRLEFEKIWLRNTIANTDYLPPRAHPEAAFRTVAGYTGKLKHIPGVLVSAGPSLRKSLPMLAELKKRTFILACDTALKPMLRAGIKPHAVFSLDAQRHTIFAYLGEDALEEIIFFADMVVHPAILRNLKVKKLIFSVTARSSTNAAGKTNRIITPGSEFAEQQHGPIGSLQSGGSVATSAFDLMLLLGCKSIILVGQDLAYSNRQIHSMGSHHYERWLARIDRKNTLEGINESVVQKRSTFPVPAIGGGYQLGDHVLDIYRRWFADSLPRVETPVYNLTAEGALIEGAQYPDDTNAFVQNLALLEEDPRACFAKGQAMEFYVHSASLSLLQSLQRIVEASNARTVWKSQCNRFRVLQELNRSHEVYINRNRHKLDEERIQSLINTRLQESARELIRFLKGTLHQITRTI